MLIQNEILLRSKILVVDDEAVNTDYLAEVLRLEGYTDVHFTNDPTKVLDLEVREGFDLILLDRHMPQMDGIEVLRALESRIKNDFLPVLMVSGIRDSESRREALEAGAKDFISKPFERWELLQRVRNFLETRCLFNERREQTQHLKRQIYKQAIELNQSKQLDDILSTGVVGFGMESLEGKTVRVNAYLCNMLGYSEDEIRGMHFTEYSHPDEAVLDLALFNDLVQESRTSYQIDKRYIRRDGSTVWGRLTRFRLKGDRERPDAIVGIVEDITKLKQSEREREVAQLRFQAIANASPTLIVLKDSEGRIEWSNRAFSESVRKAPEEIIGKTAMDIYPPDIAKVVMRHDRRVIETGEIVNHELEIPLESGPSRFRIYVRFPVHGPDGKIAGSGSVATDITDRKHMEERLREREERLAEAQRIGRMGNWVWHIQEGPLFWSDQIFRIFGQDPETFEASYDGFLACIHPDDRSLVVDAVEQALNGKAEYFLDHRIVNSAGEIRHVRERGEVLRDVDGAPIKMVGTVQDIEDEQRRESQLRMLSTIVEQSSSSVVVTDTSGTIEYVNPKFCEITGYAPEELIGQNPRVLKSDQTPADVYEEMWQTISSGREWNGELLNAKKDGSFFWESARICPLWNERSEISHFVGIKLDITERKRMESELLRQKHYDPLTGLPNRILAFDRLSERLKRAKEDGAPFGVLIINLDGFSRINAEFGMESGDAVLSELAGRLKASCEGDDVTLGRIGGDRFCAGLEGFRSTAMLELTARNILSALREPLQIGGQDYILSGTVGVSVYPHDGENIDSLLRNAEAAVRLAKNQGPNSYRFFTSSRGRLRSLRMETLLQGALERNELFLEYQPVYSIGRGGDYECTGAEALVRWQSPELGRVSPADFVPLFEDTNLAHEFGNWILEEAVRRTAGLRRDTSRDLFISVNVSPRQLRRAEFIETVSNVLGETGLPASALKLEITERMFVEKRPEVLAVLSALDEIGTNISLDDFGTGYSALRSLLDLPIRTLKIDKSFVDSLGLDARTDSMIRSIVGLCTSMDIATIAEGVETEKQTYLLAGLGLKNLQGYYFARPLGWDAYESVIKSKT